MGTSRQASRPINRYARLMIREEEQRIRQVDLTGDSLTIGRRPENDIVLVSCHISGFHGRFERQRDNWQYTDLDSTNGSSLGGKRIKTVLLNDGDVLKLGDLGGQPALIAFQLVSPEQASAAIFGSVHIGSTSLDLKTALLIGRDIQCDLHLDSPVVSRRHARLDQTSQGHVLVDLNSVNGTFVNGERLTRPMVLQMGDLVQIGPFTLAYGPDGLQQYSSASGMRLDGIDLVREVGQGDRKKRILQEINISIHPREFIALVGTSGAGKSTLMMALNGFCRAEGQVLVNGDDLYQHFDLYRTMVGYVPQDDIIHRELTVQNALQYAARLRLPPDTSDEEIQNRIDKVLEQVEMIGQREQVVNSLSGGQRKRVSIAVELLAEPSLFFLDEPTSGLDPGLEKKMMQTLRRLADEGRTIVLVTHATANIVECDHVCFLAQGRMVYFGPPQEALSYFQVTSGDFADIYTQLDDPDPRAARQKAADWEQRFQQSGLYRRYVSARQEELPRARQLSSAAEPPRGPRVSPIRQFRVLTRRYLELVLRDKLLLTVLMAVMPIIGALLLMISDHNWLVGNPYPEIDSQLTADLAGGQSNATYAIVGDSQTLLFIMALASVLLGLFASVYEIVKERSVYMRERMVSLRIIPYISSKVLVLGAFALIQCLLLMAVVAIRVDLPGKGVLLPAPIEMYITLVLGTLAAVQLGLLISAVVPNANTVIYLVFLVIFVQMIFAGVIFDLPGFAGRFSGLTLTRWTMEALGSTADMESLNNLTRTRFQPDPVTEEVSFEVERPSDDWEPVTVVTTTQDIEVSMDLAITETVPLSLPQVSLITTTQEIDVPLSPGVVRSVPISVPQVSVLTVTQMVSIPIKQRITQTVPMSVPEVTVNEVISVTEVVTRDYTTEPEPMDITTSRDFHIRYDRTAAHLFMDWGFLLGFALLCSLGTAVVLRRRDVR